MSKHPKSSLVPSFFVRLHVWQKPISLFYFNLLLALWLGLVLNYGFFEKIKDKARKQWRKDAIHKNKRFFMLTLWLALFWAGQVGGFMPAGSTVPVC